MSLQQVLASHEAGPLRLRAVTLAAFTTVFAAWAAIAIRLPSYLPQPTTSLVFLTGGIVSGILWGTFGLGLRGRWTVQRDRKRVEVRTRSGSAKLESQDPAITALARELRVAILQNQLVLHYQPKAELKSRCTEHFEVLVRWAHPRRGLVPPDEFLPLAEETGLIHPLTLWVLNRALQQLYRWRQAGPDIAIAVNLSPRTLADPDLVVAIQRLLAKWRIDPRWLEVEITESALIEDPAGAMDTLARLREMGICISIDDFGTGFSSLSNLTRLPAHQIKIDKSFVGDMRFNDSSACIVRSVIELGHNLNLQVVAEGVEDRETWEMLEKMGCDIAQGFHLGRPLCAADVLLWLQQSRPWCAPPTAAQHAS